MGAWARRGRGVGTAERAGARHSETGAMETTGGADEAVRLPPAPGASPRVHPGGMGTQRSFEQTQQDSVAHELRMLNWYKLANEAAMKAALVKQKRFKEVPRYNPAAERVRQRASWMEQVIAEEQNKPLELPADKYAKLLQQEAADRQKQAEKSHERYRKIRELKHDLEDKEMRKVQYRRFLAEQDKQRRAAMAKEGSLDALYGIEADPIEPAEVGMSVDAIINLQKLERLEERMATIIKDGDTQASEAIVLDLTQAQDVGVTAVQDGDTATLNAEQIKFIKRRTEPRLHQPSQVYYTAKVMPANEVRKEAVTLRAEFNSKDIPPHIIQHMQIMEQQRSAQSQGSMRHHHGDPRATQSADGRDLSRDELRAMGKTEAAQKRQEREEMRQRELMEQDRVDEVIKEWLRGRNRRALRRDKKVRDMLRADRRFLSSLQVAKEAKSGGAADNAAATAALSTGQGWTPNVASGEYNTDDIDKRLEVLLQQQKQMEKWKPKNSLKTA